MPSGRYAGGAFSEESRVPFFDIVHTKRIEWLHEKDVTNKSVGCAANTSALPIDRYLWWLLRLCTATVRGGYRSIHT